MRASWTRHRSTERKEENRRLIAFGEGLLLATGKRGTGKRCLQLLPTEEPGQHLRNTHHPVGNRLAVRVWSVREGLAGGSPALAHRREGLTPGAGASSGEWGVAGAESE